MYYRQYRSTQKNQIKVLDLNTEKSGYGRAS